MILDRFQLNDQAAIVTGAGRGIGAATAIGLAEAGADVVISARTDSQLAQVAEAVEAAGRRAVVVPADLSDLEAVAGLVDQARDAFGRLDLVVNNVGGAMPRPFMDTSPGPPRAGLPLQRVHRPRPAPPGRAPHAGGRTAGSVVNISSAMGRLAGRGLPGLRDGQGGAGPLHPAGRRRPGPPHPGQRHRRGLGGHLGPRHRDADRRAAGGPGGGHAARAHRPSPRTSPPPSSTWPRRPAPTSPARSSRSTGASRRPTSTWASPTYDTGTSGPRPLHPPATHDTRRTRMTKTYRVVAWGTGNVGRHALAGIDARPDLELVGPVGVNPDKVGRDAGDLAGLGRTLGVAATDDVEALLALEPDVVVHTAMADHRLMEALGRPGAHPPGRGQRRLQRTGLPPVPRRGGRRRDVSSRSATPPSRAGCRCSSTASTPGSPTTPSPWCSPASASASTRCGWPRSSTTPPTTSPW